MPQLLWDASALAKRYYIERGTDTVNALFAVPPARPMVTTYMNYAETCSLLRRKFNQGALVLSDFTQARTLLDSEVLVDSRFALLTIRNADILSGIVLSDQHNVNSTDATILAVYLRYARSRPSSAPRCILVASDQYLLRAAQSEGMKTLDPEHLAVADSEAFLADTS